MSGRVGYEFSPMPRKWHAAWAGATMAMRGLRSSLFELNDGAPVTVEGDWLTSLCKQMHVGGRERPNVRKALLDLQARGVLGVDGQTVSICFRPDSQLHRPVVDLSSIGRGSDIPLESTPRNDSSLDLKKDRKKEEKERETRAHERSARFEKPPVGEAPPNTPASEPDRAEWLTAWKVVERVTDCAGQLGHPGRHQEWLQQLVAAARADGPCDGKGELEKAVERLVRAWQADDYVQQKNPPLSNIGTWLQKRASKKQVAKQVAKIVPFDFREKRLTDAELLALDPRDESKLDYNHKIRRWDLIRREECRTASEREAAGGAS